MSIHFVERTAAELKLNGYTRNLDDGRVEVYATGAAASLAARRQPVTASRQTAAMPKSWHDAIEPEI